VGNNCGMLSIHPIRYDDSLKVEWSQWGTGRRVVANAYILGSGPHSIAVVKDGEPVYSRAFNVGEDAVESIGVPEGYKIVIDPAIDHPDPQTKGMWDDSKEKVVDHPYWKPFHDALDKLDGMRRRVGSRPVLEKIDKNPTGFENILEGKNPMENPVEEAIQFWYEREAERTVDLKELDTLRS